MDFGHTGFKVPDEREFLPIPVTPAKDIPTIPHQPSTVLETHPGRSNWSQFGGFSVPQASNGVSTFMGSSSLVNQNKRLFYFPPHASTTSDGLIACLTSSKASLDHNRRIQASTSNGVSAASSCVVNSKGFVDHHMTSFNYSDGVVSKDQNKFPHSTSNGLSGTLVASKASMDQNKFLETLASTGLSGTLVASKGSVEQKNRFSNFSEASPSNGVVACLSSKGYGDQNRKINYFPVASTSNGVISCLNLMDSLDQNSRFNNWDTIMARGNLIANRIAESHTEALHRINAASNSTVLNLSSIASQVASTGYSSGIERGGNNGGSSSLCAVPFHQINGNKQVFQTTASAKQGGNNNVVSIPPFSISHPQNQGNQQRVHSESHAVLLANCNSNVWTCSCEAQRSHLLKESTKNIAPLTPDHAKNKQNQNSEVRNGIDLSEVRNSIDHHEDEKKGEQQIVVAHKMDEGIQHPQAKTFSESVVDSSVLSTPLKENSSSVKRLDCVIDLNLTPEQKSEQKPKRKKHRPKVVIEGGPKKTPNPVPSKEGSLKEKPPVKKKYVRRKALKAPTTPAAAELTEANCPTEGNNIIKTRWALKFECENQASKENAVIALNDQEQQAPGSVDSSFCRPEYNFNHQSQDLSNRVNNSKRKYVRRKKLKASNNPAAAEVTETNIPTAETTTKETRRALNFDNENQASQENAVTLNGQEQQPPCRVESSLCPPEYNFNHLSHDLSNRVNYGNRTKSVLELTQGLQVVEEHSPTALPFDLNSPSSQMLRDSVSFPVKSAPTALPPNETKELCCGHNNTNNETHLQSTNLVGAQYDSLQVYQNIFGLNLYCQNKNNIDLQFPKSCKRKRTETGQIKRIARTFSSKTTINDSVEIAMPFRESDSRSNNFTSQGSGGASKFQSDNIWDTTNRSQPNCYSHSKNSGYSPHEENASENLPSLKMHSRITDQRRQQSKIMLSLGKPIWKKKKRSNRPTRVRDVASLIALVWCKQCPAATPKRVPTEIIHGGQICIETLLLKSHATIPKKPRTRIARRVQSLSYSRQKVFYLKRYGATFNHYRRLLAKSAAHEHNALVPYRGDSRIVPYGETYGREQKSRPKVDLDPESERVFKLLMDGTEGLDETNGDKESWWREEREVFKGRVGSFIARMHMVQGDRRYLRWKGSVVDSVIGVFLTQNVTDHFSSSAFMSLAARYPLQPSSNHQECYQLWPNRCIEQPEVGIQDSNDPIIWNPEVSSHSVYDQNGLDNSTELVQSYMGGSGLACNTRVKQYPVYNTKSTKTEKAKLVGDDYVKALVDVVSSQDSALSPVNSTDSPLHPIERIGSSSDSNSGAEDLSLRDSSSTLNAITSFMDLLNASRDTLLQEYYSDASGRVLGNTQPKGLEFNNGKSSICGTDMLEGTYKSIYPSITQTPLAQVTDICSSDSTLLDVDDQLISGEGSRFSLVSTVSESADIKEVNCTSRRFCQLVDYPPETTAQNKMASRTKAAAIDNSYNLPIVHSDHRLISSKQEANLEKKPECSKNIHMERIETFIPDDTPTAEPQNHVESLSHRRIGKMQQNPSHLPKFSDDALDVGESMFPVNEKKGIDDKNFELQLSEKVHSGDTAFNETNNSNSKTNGKVGKEKLANFDWDSLRKEVHRKGIKRERNSNSRDSLDYEAVRCADVNEIANAIKARGMNNMLAERIKDFLSRLVKEHESIDLEWLRDVPPEKAKDFLLSIRGLGLKSVECVRLLTLHHHAFPVDTNVARIAVRLGWVPLQPLPEDLQIHLLELYPMLESVQKYLWPRLCTLDQKTLYELHYQMITFGKVFCTKRAPNCNACPMRAECRHFASAFASAKLALPGPEEKRLVPSTVTVVGDCNSDMHTIPTSLPLPEVNLLTGSSRNGKQEPIIEEPTSPEPYHSEITVQDIEDAFYEDPDEIPTINLSMEEFALNLQNYVQQNNVGLQEGDLSKALVALSPEAASIPLPKLKTVTRLRTEHQVYRLPDEHPLLREMERREPDDPCYYLLAIWTPGETAESLQEERCCSSDGSSNLYNNNACDSIQEENSQAVKGTILIPTKTAMRGSFPLNGTYFQVNEVFADHKTSLNPITVPRDWIWNLERRTVFFGTSVTAIFRGLSTEAIQSCFWRGYVCVRGFDQKSRTPRPLARRFHIAASKLPRGANGRDDM